MENVIIYPTYSIVLTCFNREKSIKAAIDSVLNQTFQDFELVIIDDCSLDNSLNVIKGYSDPRIKVIAHGVNQGQNAALNSGLLKCEGELVAFLDSDDVYDESFLSEMLIPFRENKDFIVDFAYCRLVHGPKWKLSGINLYRQVLQQGYLSALGTLVVRRQFLEGHLPLPSHPEIKDMCQDDRLCFELSRNGSFVHIPKELYRAIGNEDSVTSNLNLMARGWEKLFLDYKNEIVSRCGNIAMAKHMSKVLSLYAHAGDWKSAIKLLNSSIQDLYSSKLIENAQVRVQLYLFIPRLFKMNLLVFLRKMKHKLVSVLLN